MQFRKYWSFLQCSNQVRKRLSAYDYDLFEVQANLAKAVILITKHMLIHTQALGAEVVVGQQYSYEKTLNTGVILQARTVI